jgi:hypothetical protein
MYIVEKLIKLLTLNQEQKPYWIEIKTKEPRCTYYFGPFDSRQEAKLLQAGYIEDLVNEKAQGISVEIKQCEPTELTIVEEEEDF